MLGSARLSDKAIKTLSTLSQRTGQLQPRDRINLSIMMSSSLVFPPIYFFSLLCGERAYPPSVCQRDENKSVLNRSSLDWRGLFKR